MSFELAITIEEAAKVAKETTDWMTIGVGGGIALLGSVVGGLFAMRAVNRQFKLNHEEADRKAFFDINAKLISIADESARLSGGLASVLAWWEKTPDDIPEVELTAAPEVHRFTLEEQYRAFRIDGSALVDTLLMVERGELAMMANYSNAIEIRRIVAALEIPERSTKAGTVLAAMQDYRAQTEHLQRAIEVTINSANLTNAAARDAQAQAADFWKDRQWSVLPSVPERAKPPAGKT